MQEAKDALYSRLPTIGNLVHDSVPVNNNEVSVLLLFCVFFFEWWNDWLEMCAV